MATNREILLDIPSYCEKGCRLQLWAEGGAFHIGAACDYCKQFILKLVQEFYPDIKVTETP